MRVAPYLLATLMGLWTCQTFAQDRSASVPCAECRPAARVLVPVTRMVTLNAGMYAGLVILWPDSFAPRAASRSQFTQAWTKAPYADMRRGFMTLDGDPAWINGPLHALYGAELYLSVRGVGYSPMIAFGFAVFGSMLWEYGIESWFQRPSAIDIVWTPFSGAVLGELRFQLLRITHRRVDRPVPRTLLLVLLDPLGMLERRLLNCHIR